LWEFGGVVGGFCVCGLWGGCFFCVKGGGGWCAPAPPHQCVLTVLVLRVKRPWLEAYLQPVLRYRMSGAIPQLLHTPS